MARRGAWAAGAGGAIAAAVAIVLLASAGSDRAQFAENAPRLPWEDATVTLPPRPAADDPTLPPTPPFEPVQGTELPAAVTAVLVLAAVGGVVAVVVFGVRRAQPRWRERRDLRGWRPPTGEVAPDLVPDDAALVAVAADAQEQRAALLRGTPRNAVVECWMRLEAAVVSAGIDRDPSDTSTELTQRVLGRHAVDPGALRTLAALYREARFSDHELDEEDRAFAVAALDAVHAGLRDDEDLEVLL
jgi:hypothetical protein